MKITLIEPKAPGLHIFSRVKLPRLGLPMIGTLLKQKGHDVKIFVEEISGEYMNRALDSDIVGISTTTSTAPRSYSIADKIKKINNKIQVIMGGPHVSFMIDESLEHCDYCVIGEGENVITSLVESLEKNLSPASIPGLAFKNENGERQMTPKERPQNIETLPFPDLSLIDNYEKMSVIPMATSRGCPYGCRFCSVIRMFGREYRCVDIKAVVDEIEKLPPAHIFFYDDNFTADRERTMNLLQEIIDRDLSISWSAQTRVEVGDDPKLLEMMQKAGCKIVYIGFESVNPASLEEFDKKADLEQSIKAIKAYHKYGIHVHGMFVIGADHDDIDTPRKTVDFALEHGIDTIQLIMLTPIPGTPYFNDMVKQDRLVSSNWQYFDGLHAVHKPANMTPYGMQYEVIKNMVRFYSLKRSMKLLSKFRFANSGLHLYGWYTLKKWLSDKKNQAYLTFLKENYSPQK